MRRLLLVLPVAVLLVIGGVSLFRARPVPGLGRPAPAFTLPDLADPSEQISLPDDARGRRVVLNFWASWCAPCKEEAPAFARAAREFDEVSFLGVNILDGREEALAFARRAGIGYPSARDGRGTIAKRFGVNGAPETFFIDTRGRVVGRHIGAFEGDELEELLREFVRLPVGETLRVTTSGDAEPVP